jgi:hypothetical protein
VHNRDVVLADVIAVDNVLVSCAQTLRNVLPVDRDELIAIFAKTLFMPDTT